MSEEKTFTQSEVDEIIQDRVRRAKRSQERSLEEVQTEAVADLPDYKKQYFDNLRKIKLLEAGLPLDQLEKYAKYVTAESEKEIEAEALELTKDLSPKGKQQFADPSSRRNSVWNPFN